ncbi:hypothetical protein INT44_002604 [Umbelopsis vinacea]|uniref:Small ribosomal subunit protein mS38 n=1 Tax=Umbelopsis vinacea TaxID=44442 RepID=A0A8H7PEQ9_9FUNG|nr:hypothetical protein INT44_002604 [Umbelopsis vinacea]KAI9286735.1 hypothetical protein BC943DRAFT_229447 [Umbelopsis sp. AD052]
MQRAFSILPRLQPILTPARLVSMRWASSATSTPLASVNTMPLSLATPAVQPIKVSSLTQYMATLKPFQAPAAPQPTMHATSVLRKRKLKMNKHKHKKLMKRTRALRKRIGK